jgi:microcystin-dependent protein
LTNGQAVSRTIYAALFSVVGTTFGIGDGSTTFNIPDYRGRTAVMQDGAGRITTACAAANTIGTACGAQNYAIANGNLPAFIPFTDPGHQHSTVHTLDASVVVGGAAFGASSNAAGTTGATTTGITINPGGANTPLSTIDPSLIANKIIRY